MQAMSHRRWTNAMKDMQVRLEKVRVDATEWVC
jgi:hypothetical protein